MRRHLSFAILIGLLVLGLAPLPALRAQNNAVTITLAIPSMEKDFFNESLLKEFETSHPNINVSIVTSDAQIPSPAGGMDAFFKAAQDYANAADVLYVSSNALSPAATRAGYLLDLAPLTSIDKTLNADDFYPAAWKSFQWDQGVWALPTGMNISLLAYKPSAFDAAGLAYPNGKWTLDDLANAMRKLVKKDASGSVTGPSILVGGRDEAALLQSLIDASLFDAGTPDTPHFDTPAAEKVLDTWYQLKQENLFASDLSTVPMAVLPAVVTSMPGGGDVEKWAGSALPGGKIAIETDGFAISAGTQHVNEAYALVAYLTTRAESMGPLSTVPARKSLASTLGSAQPGGGVTTAGNPDGGSSTGGGAVRIMPSLPDDIKPLVEPALNDSLAVSDLRYADYLEQAVSSMKSNHVDAAAALQAAEAAITKDQQTALNAKDKTTVVVATPIPVVAVPGKITLKFGITSFMMPMPNQDAWTKLAQDFAASDPQVGRVDIQTNAKSDLAGLADQNDCFYMPYNAVPGANLTNLLNLDPFLAADKTFDRSGLVADLVPQLQRDNKTWAYPLMIEPELLSYNSKQFAKANVPEPASGWTIDAFVDALKALKTSNPQQPPFDAISAGGTHLLMLMAAYGGLPLDYRTDPPTAKFTDAANAAAIRQVLDLAKNGYIKYTALGAMTGFMVVMNSGEGPAITTEALAGPGARLMRKGSPDQAANPYKLVPYPTGAQYNALAYAVDTAYISAKTQNPDACYRWISAIALHAELFSAMPARRSQINAQATTAAQGPDIVAAYNQVDALLKDPKTVIFPSLFQGGASPAGFLVQHWLYQAFDSYVLHDGDLDSALKDAQTSVDGFQACTASIAPYDPSNADSAATYQKAYLDCAVKVDPQLKNFAQKGN